MKIISKSHIESKTYYEIDFVWNGNNFNNGGFSFPCDESGTILFEEMQDAAISNYNKCIDGTYEIKCIGKRKQTYSWTEPAIGICENCGREIQLTNDYCGATECECGKWYAIGGYAINPPQMWAEPIDYD